ncbi:MAG: ABC transporter substrate-binding protein [Gammaproteobacteria bacterium]|nr:ABC transporter substrate-binding protein [Gammaproteobacteria bacterium]
MLSRLFSLVVLIATTSISPVFAVEHQAPQPLVENVTQKVLAELRQPKGAAVKDASFLTQKIEEHIVPHVDMTAMSKLVLGKHWRAATDAQKEQFMNEFKKLLIRTYQKSLSAYSNEKIAFEPFHPSAEPNKLATVKTKIVRGNGPSIAIDYDLRFKAEDGWKLYDITVESVSLVTNYRSSFSTEVTQQGLDHLIQTLKDRNAKAISGNNAKK